VLALVAAGGSLANPPVVDPSRCGAAYLAAPSSLLDVQPSGLMESQVAFMDGEIRHLLAKQALQELLLHECAMISLISVVLKKNGKSQLIINMHLLNTYLRPPKFKYQSLHNLATLLQLGDFLFMIDFKDGFHHMEVHPDHQHLLSFHWWNCQYVFCAFPFSLNALLWVFTQFMCAMMLALMVKGVQCMVYMDDLIVMAPS
jgi:hypothetical protein